MVSNTLPKPQVVVESPYAGDIDRNLAYGRAAVRDSLLRGEVPHASHLLYTQEGILRDDVPEERELGMSLGWEVTRISDHVVVYCDRGFSSGMIRGIRAALEVGKPIKGRFLYGDWHDPNLIHEKPCPVELIGHIRFDS